MKETSCPYCDRGENVVTETPFWRILLHEDQSYLGRCMVVLKRHCGSLGELAQEECENFGEVVRKLEAAIASAFNPTLFNWNCSMNNAYRKKPFNPHIHWHVRPRYQSAVKFGGEIFEDEEFGKRFDPTKKRNVSDKVRLVVIDAIRRNL